MQAPKLPSFFNSIKHRRFDFPTRYYSERKEKIDNIKAKNNDINFKQVNKIENNAVKRKIRLTLIFFIMTILLILLFD